MESFVPKNSLEKFVPNEYPVEDFDYKLVDNGGLRKLEHLGLDYYVIRPAPQALWPCKIKEGQWNKACAEFRYSKGKSYGGNWSVRRKLPAEGWNICFRQLTLKLNVTGFGHIGIFPEQASNWVWIEKMVKTLQPDKVINIFGYTGVSTLMAAGAGAQVTHVDSSKPSVSWARENQNLSGLKGWPVRWIVDDVIKFLRREDKRGNRYDGIIMDPPTFGRGAKGEVWQIEKNLPELLELCKKVLTPEPLFILFTTHSPGFSSLTLENLLKTYLIDGETGFLESGEMFVHDMTSGIHLPNGFFVRWFAG